jgi:hypothetical protein
MPAAAALTSTAAAGQAVVEAAVVAAAAEAAQPTAAHLGERPATGRKLDTKAGTGTGLAISTPGTVAPMATAAEDSRGEAELTTDTSQATANSTAGSTAIVAAAAEWLK